MKDHTHLRTQQHHIQTRIINILIIQHDFTGDTAKIEELISELSTQYTIAIVTHSMQQAARVSDRTAYFHLGDLIEVNATEKVFTQPDHQLTEAYITGRFG